MSFDSSWPLANFSSATSIVTLYLREECSNIPFYVTFIYFIYILSMFYLFVLFFYKSY